MCTQMATSDKFMPEVHRVHSTFCWDLELANMSQNSSDKNMFQQQGEFHRINSLYLTMDHVHIV